MNSVRRVILHATGAELLPDLTFEEWRDVSKILKEGLNKGLTSG
jgi:hypothetical protein